MGSSDSQATRHELDASHWVISVVLPNPAGAETTTNRGIRLPSTRSSSVRRGRGTNSRRGNGTLSFVPSNPASGATVRPATHSLDSVTPTNGNSYEVPGSGSAT